MFLSINLNGILAPDSLYVSVPLITNFDRYPGPLSGYQKITINLIGFFRRGGVSIGCNGASLSRIRGAASQIEAIRHSCSLLARYPFLCFATTEASRLNAGQLPPHVAP
jgi:hypothetical protein